MLLLGRKRGLGLAGSVQEHVRNRHVLGDSKAVLPDRVDHTKTRIDVLHLLSKL